MNKYIKFLIVPIMLFGMNSNSCYSMRQYEEYLMVPTTVDKQCEKSNNPTEQTTQVLDREFQKLLYHYKEIKDRCFGLSSVVDNKDLSSLQKLYYADDIEEKFPDKYTSLYEVFSNISDRYLNVINMIECVLYNYKHGMSYAQDTLISESGAKYQSYKYHLNNEKIKIPLITLQHVAYHYAITILNSYIDLYNKVSKIIRTEAGVDSRMELLSDINNHDIKSLIYELQEWAKQIFELKETLFKLDNKKPMDKCYESFFNISYQNLMTCIPKIISRK